MTQPGARVRAWLEIGDEALAAAAGLSLIGGEAIGFWGAVGGVVVGSALGVRFAVASRSRRNGWRGRG